MDEPVELSATQLACLASLARNDAFMTIRSLGEASVKQIAAAMGRSPESLYYHVKELLRANLIRESYRRPTARIPESVYAAAAKNFRLPDLIAHPELAPLARKSIAVGLRHAIRGYETAARNAESDPGIRAFLGVVRATSRMIPEDAAAFFALIEAASRFAKEHESVDGVRICWTSLVYPDAKGHPGMRERDGSQRSLP